MNFQSFKAKAQNLKVKLGLLYFAFQDNRTPWYAKAMIALVIAYALSPFDLIPDFIPILGYLDDLILIPAGIALAIKLIPDQVRLECSEKQWNLTKSGRYRIYGGMIVIAIWALLIYLIFRAWKQLYSIPAGHNYR